MSTGMKCPACGSIGPFVVSTSMITWISEAGVRTVDMDSIAYENDDLCTCHRCDHSDDLKEFKVIKAI